MAAEPENKTLLVIEMLRNPKYLGLVLGLSIFMLFLYPFLQVLPQGLNNFWFWFSLLTPLTWLLYFLYVILFGLTLPFFFWQRSKKLCSLKKETKGGFFGLVGSFFGVSTSICPACLSWVVLFLPFSFGLSLVKYSIEIMVFSILLLLLALWFWGGFRRN